LNRSDSSSALLQTRLDLRPWGTDRLLEKNAAFRRLCEESKREADDERVSTLAEVRRRLLGPE
jgi:hypothetical protein